MCSSRQRRQVSARPEGAPLFQPIEAQIIGARRALASSPLSAEKVEYLAAFVQHKCDAIDGVADGVVDDPRRCTVDFATEIPACGAGGDAKAEGSERNPSVATPSGRHL